MKLMSKFLTQLLFESSVPLSFSKSFPRHNRNSLSATCLQCKIRTQARRFADIPKPPLASTSAAIGISHATPPEQSASDLPSAEQGRRLAATKHFSHLMDHLQDNIFIASQRINDLTGYSGIEALKGRIAVLEKRVEKAQEAVRSARLTYKTTVADRASTQREVTTLLARKDSWTPADLERFTALYRMDHSNEQAVQEAATRLADAEMAVEDAATKLSSSILSRYHEEQIWSDKIRRMSTWGTWGLMGVNVLLFLVFQFGLEPWRRRRLVHGFEEKVREAFVQVKISMLHDGNTGNKPAESAVAADIQELNLANDNESASSEPAVDTVFASARDNMPKDATRDRAKMIATTYTEARRIGMSAAKDLLSDRIVEMRKKDVTIIALKGAAVGATIVTIFATLLRQS